MERSADAPATVQQIMQLEVPTCSPDDRVETVRRSVKAFRVCAVTNERGVLLGVIDSAALERAGTERANHERAVDLMSEAPVTVRPSTSIETVGKRIVRDQISQIWVTTGDGELFGMVAKADLESRSAGKIRYRERP
jgi:CBS domain-containing protein